METKRLYSINPLCLREPKEGGTKADVSLERSRDGLVLRNIAQRVEHLSGERLAEPLNRVIIIDRLPKRTTVLGQPIELALKLGRERAAPKDLDGPEEHALFGADVHEHVVQCPVLR